MKEGRNAEKLPFYEIHQMSRTKARNSQLKKRLESALRWEEAPTITSHVNQGALVMLAIKPSATGIATT